MRENLPPNLKPLARAVIGAAPCALQRVHSLDARPARSPSTTLYGDTVYVVASRTGYDRGAVGAPRKTEGERQGMPTSALLAQEQTHELVRLDAEGSGHRHQRLEGRAQLPALDPTDVVPVQPRLEAQSLLRVATFQAQPAEGGTERGKIALWRDGGFWHATGRSQAGRSQSTSFAVTSYKGDRGPRATRPRFPLDPDFGSGHQICIASDSLVGDAGQAHSPRARGSAAGDPSMAAGDSRPIGRVVRGTLIPPASDSSRAMPFYATPTSTITKAGPSAPAQTRKASE